MRYIQDPNNPRRRIEVPADPPPRPVQPSPSREDYGSGIYEYRYRSSSLDGFRIALYVILQILIIGGIGAGHGLLWFRFFEGDIGYIVVYILAVISFVAAAIPFSVRYAIRVDISDSWSKLVVAFFISLIIIAIYAVINFLSAWLLLSIVGWIAN